MVKTKAKLAQIVIIVLLSLIMMVGGIVFLCQEVAMPPSQMEENIEVEAGECTISYNIKKVYGNGNPNSAKTGINFEATVAIGNKDRGLKA